MSKCLAIYDITGIQSYIFKTRELQDIIGASHLVQTLFETSDQETNKINRKLIFSGGGNAILSFETEGDYRKFNGLFSRELLEKSPGIQFVTCFITEGSDWGRNLRKLFDLVNIVKQTQIQFYGFNTLPPMMQASDNKEQVVEQYEEEWYSYTTLKKKLKGRDITAITDTTSFDYIGKAFISGTERMMAVVHIDGNNMGELLRHACKLISSADELSNISKEINQAFEDAEKVMKDYISEIESKMYERDNIAYTDGNPHYRLIYQSGDDVTFVCHSSYAITAVCKFFSSLFRRKEKKDLLIKKISACAGIAFIKPHYPFDKAVEIAMEGCKNAKTAAKSSNKELDIGFWLDYQLIKGTDLSYTVTENSRYHVPYYVGGLDNIHMESNIGVLATLLVKVQKSKNNNSTEIPRKKLKSIWEAFLLGNQAYEIAIMESMGYSFASSYFLYRKRSGATFTLDKAGRLQIGGKRCAIYDALELMDVHTETIEDFFI